MTEADDVVPHQEPAGQDPQGTPATERWFDESWHKVHPLSPFVRGWVTIVAIPAIVFGYNYQIWVDMWQAWQSGELTAGLQQNPTPYLLGGGAFAVLILAIFSGYVLSWWFTRYQVTDEHVMVKSGIFVRQHRQARIDRVQAVDIRQPLLARFTRLAELRFEVAEGDGTAATLAFLRKPEANELRREIMDRAAGRGAPAAEPESLEAEPESREGEPARDPAGGPAAAGGDPEAPNSPLPPTPPLRGREWSHSSTDQGAEATISAQAPVERQIVRVPTGRLIGSVLAGGGTFVLVTLVFFWLVAMVVGLIVMLATGDGTAGELLGIFFAGGVGGAPLLVPLGIAAIFAYYNQLASGFGFTATMTEAGLRLRYGLLEKTTQTIPPGRVQAIEVRQSLLWRPFGWYQVVVTVAGYGLTGRTTLLPVGRRQDVTAVAAEMFPDLQIERPEEIFVHGLDGRGTALGFTEVPARARGYDPLVRRRRGFFPTPTALMIRDGRLSRKLTMVPHERIQSAALHQGPLARFSRIATLHLHLPTGPVTARAKNQDLETVKHLFEQEAAQAAVARRLADRNQWMLPEELHEFEKNVAEAAEKL